VTKLYVPEEFDLNRFFQGVFHWQEVANHSKYRNNYDYHKALWLLDSADLLENGFLLLKEEETISSPVASVHYERYDDLEKLEYQLKAKRAEIQCIVGHGYVPFGRAQQPALDDYADGVDTMAFLSEL